MENFMIMARAPYIIFELNNCTAEVTIYRHQTRLEVFGEVPESDTSHSPQREDERSALPDNNPCADLYWKLQTLVERDILKDPLNVTRSEGVCTFRYHTDVSAHIFLKELEKMGVKVRVKKIVPSTNRNKGPDEATMRQQFKQWIDVPSILERHHPYTEYEQEHKEKILRPEDELWKQRALMTLQKERSFTNLVTSLAIIMLAVLVWAAFVAHTFFGYAVLILVLFFVFQIRRTNLRKVVRKFKTKMQ